MKKVVAIVITAAMTVPLLNGCTAVVDEPVASTTETTVKELGPARAEDDYFRFVNQERFNTTEIKYGDVSYDYAFNTELTDDQIEAVIDDVAAGSGYVKGSEEDIIKHAYDYYQAYDFENEPIPEDLMNVIDRIDNAGSVDELLDIDAMLARDYGMSSMIGLVPDINPFDPNERVMTFVPLSGILDATFVDMREDNYALNYVKEDAQIVLTTRGYDKETAEQYGKELAFVALDIFSATDLDMAEDDMMAFKYSKIVPADEVNGYLSNIDLEK